MVQLLGTNLKNNYKVINGFSKLFGVGKHTTILMLNDLNIGYNFRIKDLTQSTFVKVIKWIEKNQIIVESALKQKINNNISKLKSVKSYRGLRHSQHLPVRGQRTKTNASSAKKLSSKK